VNLVIEDTRNEGLPRPHTPALYTSKYSRFFDHLYEKVLVKDATAKAALHGDVE
jgi:hypothetical protein